jgi:CrcB protein
MNAILLVGIGGAAGSIIRYLCQRSLNSFHFPYGTLTVNITGCFIIGIFWGLLAKGNLSESGRLLLMSGFCGGFTTFSAFTHESIHLLTQQRFQSFFIYVLISVAASLLATFAGYKLIT